MVLSSQMSRSGSGRSYMYAKKRKRPGGPRSKWLVILIVIASAVALWWFFGRTDENGNSFFARNDSKTQIDDASTSPYLNSSTATPNNNTSNRDDSTDHPIERNLPSSDRNPSQSPNSNDDGGDDHYQPTNNPASESSGNRGNDITMGGGTPASSSDQENTSTPSRTNDPPVQPTTTASPRLSGGSDEFGADPGPAVQQFISQAEVAVDRGNLVEGRRLYNEALHHADVGRAASTIRDEMYRLNQTLVFSPQVRANDPFAFSHTIVSGDRGVKLARTAHVESDFLGRINGMNMDRIRLDTSIKMMRGPFHAVIDKSDYRMDIYIGNADRYGKRMYVCSFPVGLGEHNGTPSGSWIIRKNSKVKDPGWTNPRTGEVWKASDPNIPIGERWIGLRGLDPDNRNLSSYGIHGTNEPDTIGRQASMGCVRMAAGDVEIVYEILMSDLSTVIIRP